MSDARSDARSDASMSKFEELIKKNPDLDLMTIYAMMNTKQKPTIVYNTINIDYSCSGSGSGISYINNENNSNSPTGTNHINGYASNVNFAN